MDTGDDCEYWNLTRLQEAQYRCRLADYQYRRAVAHRDECYRYSDRVNVVLWVLAISCLAAILLSVLSLIV